MGEPEKKKMRSIFALGLLIALYGTANAAALHHAHRRHVVVRPMIASDPASAFAYTPAGPPIYYQPAPYNVYNQPYPGASLGYAPGEYSRFIDSVRRGG
jgi:hypothetical protein